MMETAISFRKIKRYAEVALTALGLAETKAELAGEGEDRNLTLGHITIEWTGSEWEVLRWTEDGGTYWEPPSAWESLVGKYPTPRQAVMAAVLALAEDAIQVAVEREFLAEEIVLPEPPLEYDDPFSD